MKKIQILGPGPHNYNLITQLLSQHAGTVKLLAGAPLNASLVVLREAIYMLRHSCYFKGKAKPLIRQVDDELRLFLHNIKHPQDGELRLFDVNTFNEEYRKDYKEGMTNDNYYEFWESIGNELYARTRPLIMSVAYKFERHYKETYCREPDVLARVMIASALINIAIESFDYCVLNGMRELPPTIPAFNRMMRALDIRLVYDRLERVIGYITPTGSEMTADELHDVNVGLDAIIEKWANPAFIHDIEMDMMKEFRSDVYSKGTYRRLMAEQKQKHQELLETMAESKRERLSEQLKLN